MVIGITHSKNPAAGWDISVQVQATEQRIVEVSLFINGASLCNERIDPTISWSGDFTQKGVWPGTNRVVAVIIGEDGAATRSESTWE